MWLISSCLWENLQHFNKIYNAVTPISLYNWKNDVYYHILWHGHRYGHHRPSLDRIHAYIT